MKFSFLRILAKNLSMWLMEFANFLIETFQHNADTVLFIAIGFAAGVFAQMILPGKGFGLGASLALGLLGCLIGNYYLYKYLVFLDSPLLKKIVAGTAGAMILMVPINFVKFHREKDKTKYRNNT